MARQFSVAGTAALIYGSIMNQVEYTDAVPGATEGKNEMMRQNDVGTRAKMDGTSLIIGDDFIVHVGRFDSYEQFLKLPFVQEHQRDPRFIGFAVRAENRRSVKAFYQGGFILRVGLAKNDIGLEKLPTEQELRSQPPTQPANAPATANPAAATPAPAS